MSENILHFVPTDPDATPAETDAALGLLRAAFPDSGGVDVESNEMVQFIDCGGNFESVKCPACRTDLLEDGSWGDMMSAAWDSGMVERRFDLPCCGANVAIEALVYFWPVAFGKLSLSVLNPGVECFRPETEWSEFENSLLDSLRSALGIEVSAHWQHI